MLMLWVRRLLKPLELTLVLILTIVFVWMRWETKSEIGVE
jgi:hypothetical protein